jgi:hypothetical protein
MTKSLLDAGSSVLAHHAKAEIEALLARRISFATALSAEKS